MAFERFFPFRSVSGDRKYSAEDWAAYFAQFIGNGVFYNDASSLKVVENEDMKIAVKPGAGFAAGRMYMLEDGKVLDIETADGAVDRIDRVVLRCDYVNRLMSVEVIKGSYGITAPAITRNADVFELALADVYVKAGTLEITAADITDQRLNTELCGIVTGLIEQADTTEIFNQLQTYFNQFKGRTEADLQEFKNKTNADIQKFENNMMADFEEWYENYKAVLSGDAEGNLLKLIEETQHGLENQIVETNENTLVGSKAGGLQIVNMRGKSEQATTTGAQLLDASKIKTTYSGGATVTNNGDGSFTISGSGAMTDGLSVSYNYTHEETVKLLKAGMFYFKHKGDITTPYFYLQLRNSQGTIKEMSAASYSAQYEINQNHLDDDSFVMIVGFYGGKGSTIKQGTIQPMIYQEGDGTWEPYTGGIAAPNPEYKEPVVSAGQMLVEGRNLFDVSAVKSNETVINNGDGTLTVKGYSVTAGQSLKELAPMLSVGDVVYLNAKSTGVQIFYLQGANESWNFGTSKTITEAMLTSHVLFYCERVDGVNSDATISDIIICKDGNATYEPYTGGVKGSYDTGIEYTISGANLFDATKAQIGYRCNVNGSVVKVDSPKYATSDYIEVEGGASYYLTNVCGNVYCSVVLFDENKTVVGTNVVGNGKVTSGVITVSADTKYIRINIITDEVDINTVMVNKGSTALPYEPYTEQTLTISRVLRGIPVTDSSLATYTDEKGQMWRADYIDVKRKVLVQTVGAYTVNQVLSYDFTESALKWQYGLYFTENINKLKGTSAKHYTNVMNDKFVMVSQSVEGLEETGTCCGFYGHAHGIEFRFRLLKSKYATAEEAKNAIVGSTVYYPLTEPVEIPLTDEEIIALHSIMSGDTVTYMECENEVKPVTTKQYGVTEVGALTLENKNLHTVNETLRKNQLTKADFIVSGDTLILGWL